MHLEKNFHHRNLHNTEYDYDALTKSHPPLKTFIKENQYGMLGINYGDANAVLALNQALLIHHYGVSNWNIPKGNLCPAIPGRADYIHHIADLLSKNNKEEDIPQGTKIKGLDIGTGASCIYPLLGNAIYGWKFVGSDISSPSINHAKSNLNFSKAVKKNIKLRFQKTPNKIFSNIVKKDEFFNFTMCNPPFYSSKQEAKQASNRKTKNLNINKIKKGNGQLISKPNFAGEDCELWCEGGELQFLRNMILESKDFQKNCQWFTTLVSNKKNIPLLQEDLKKVKSDKNRVIQMNHGNKISHILAWRY